MKSCNAPKNQPTRRTLPIACAIALAVASTVSLAEPVHADITPPSVPFDLQVPPGNELFLVGHVLAAHRAVDTLPDAMTSELLAMHTVQDLEQAGSELRRCVDAFDGVLARYRE